MELIKKQTYDEERAFYGTSGLILSECSFDGGNYRKNHLYSKSGTSTSPGIGYQNYDFVIDCGGN